MAIFCGNCGNKLNDTALKCERCGTIVESNQVNTTTDKDTNVQTNGLAIAGMIIGIVSIISCGSFSLIGLILSIIGLIKSKKINKAGKSQAIAGIILNILGFGLSIIIVSLYVIAILSDMY